MAWIESHQDIGQHPKTLELMSRLNVDLPTAVGILHLVWHFTLKFSWESGDLTKYSPEIIAQSIHWKGDASELIKALQDSGWLDGMIVHDWEEFTLHYNLSMEKQERQKSQVRERVKRWRNAKVTNRKALRNKNVTQCNAPTVPDLTVPDLTKPKKKNYTRILHFSKPTASEVTAYAASIGFRLDGEKFCAHYESNGWKVGKVPMVRWQSAVVTWMKRADPSALMAPAKPRIPDPKPEDCIQASDVTKLLKSLSGKEMPHV